MVYAVLLSHGHLLVSREYQLPRLPGFYVRLLAIGQSTAKELIDTCWAGYDEKRAQRVLSDYFSGPQLNLRATFGFTRQ